MLLRPRQEKFVDRVTSALKAKGNSLGVAPTGAGKTVMFSAIAARFPSVLVLQHRKELVSQNMRTFKRLSDTHSVGQITADAKQFSRDATFAMVQTLCREHSLDKMKPVDLLVVDEAHHAVAPTYRRIIDRARDLNPKLRILGVTATPNRGDKKGLRAVFTNCGDQITVGELIRSGHLVRPEAHVIDVGINDQLAKLNRTSTGEYDLDEAAALMSDEPVMVEILRHWREKAGDRQTVVFAANVQHAYDVTEAFSEQGVTAEVVTGKTLDAERDAIFARVDSGETQVLVNVAVATEGWDCPPISCVMLLRPSSYQSTMVQMIGRGLRVLDAERYPGRTKSDCVILDFGRSILTHGGIEQIVDLEGEDKDEDEKGEAPLKECEECGAEVPIQARRCPFCGAEFEGQAKGLLQQFEMRLVEIVEASPFKWRHHNDQTMIANGLSAFAVVFEMRDQWFAAGVVKDDGMRKAVRVCQGDKAICLAAADDFLRVHGDAKAARKTKRWLSEPPSIKQASILGLDPTDFSLTKYDASCEIDLRFNRSRISDLYVRDRAA